MAFLRGLLLLAGLALALCGTVFALRGAGISMWPAESFMLAQPEWAIYGAIAFGVGAALFWFGMRRRG